VDELIPGDRAARCQGLMEPVGVIQKNGKWRIIHKCVVCGKRTVMDTATTDNMEVITELAGRPVF